MSQFLIDPGKGTIHLPGGATLSADQTQDAFRTAPAFADARDRNYGTRPWIHHEFSGGQVDGHNLFVSACFYDQLLVNVSISVDLYPPGAKDWSNYSLDTETEIKILHDELLKQMFDSKPKKLPPLKMQNEKHAPLGRALCWSFKWGSAGSYHDSKGGGTYIVVEYDNRKEKCERAYRQRKP
jgi:hypothetical protein